jgi:hypothetical protein
VGAFVEGGDPGDRGPSCRNFGTAGVSRYTGGDCHELFTPKPGPGRHMERCAARNWGDPRGPHTECFRESRAGRPCRLGIAGSLGRRPAHSEPPPRPLQRKNDDRRTLSGPAAGGCSRPPPEPGHSISAAPSLALSRLVSSSSPLPAGSSGQLRR